MLQPLPSAEPFFVLRSPSLPFDVLEGWSRETSVLDAADLEAALAEDRARLRRRLRDAVRDPAVREALFLASPDLESTLDPWLRMALPPERADRVERSLVRYLSRMAYRCTPFGLFAGTTTGRWGGAALELQEWRASRRHTRMDMDVLAAILAELEKLPAVRSRAAFRPNTSLYHASGRLRYMEARGGTGRGREYHLVDLVPSAALEQVLALAQGGAAIQALAVALAEWEQVDLEEARRFCLELVDAQVLVGDLQATLTGREALGGATDRLASGPSTRDLARPLEAWAKGLAELDRRGPGNDPAAYRALMAELEPYAIATDPNRLFQVDQHRPAQALELPPRVRRTLEEGVDLLRRLTPRRPPGPLEAFKAAFLERYERRWMPLLEVLDSEAGIGFGAAPAPADAGAPLLDGLPFPGEAAPPASFTARDAHLLRRLQTLGGALEWELDDADLRDLEDPEAPAFPESFAALATLDAASAEALAAGDFRVAMGTFSGPSGSRLLARFCLGDPELEALVRQLARNEEAGRPEAVFAEVVHLPDGRTGNILARPVLRPCEIPFLGAGCLDHRHQILPSELLVNVVEGRVVLWSGRLGREVVPRLSSAHNYARGLAVYRFLGQVQDQDGGSGGWTWGALRSAPFLPRVSRGRIILSKARWRIEGRELAKAALEAQGSPWQAFALLRRRRGLPRLVVLEDADNALLVDLDQALWVETLWHLVKDREAFALTECLPAPDHLALKAPEGRFTHELVVPFRGSPVRRAPVQRPLEPTAERTFPPGSSWLYAKVYCGRAAADRILLEAIAPFARAARGLWDRWFFVRYADPRPHLRLRFHGRPDKLAAELLPRLFAALEPMREQGLAWRLQVDTYERELERYGGPEAMDLAEAWFWRDSERVLEDLEACLGDEAAPERWRRALADAHRILLALGLDLEGRLRVARAGRDGLLREFGPHLAQHLGAKFRPMSRDLGALLAQADSQGAPGLEGLAALGARARAQAAGPSLEALAATLVHMHLNRWLRTEHRAQELVLLDFLHRCYGSEAARVSARRP